LYDVGFTELPSKMRSRLSISIAENAHIGNTVPVTSLCIFITTLAIAIEIIKKLECA